MQLVFGPGAAWMIDGDAVPTPISFGVLQSAAIDLTASNKDLYGQGQLPVAVGRGQIKVGGKMQFAQMNGRMIKDFFGSTMNTGQTLVAQNESKTIPASSPYTLSVTNAATFTSNLGVVYAATGIPLVAVASAPASGQYSYSAGVYTFAAADTSLGVYISYTYTATGGNTITITNANQGAAQTFKTVTNMVYNGQQSNFTLNACVSKSLKFATKQQDFNHTDFDFDAFTDASNTLGTITVAEIS